MAHLSLPEAGLTAHCLISYTDNVRQGKNGTRPARFHGNHIGPVLVKLTHGQGSRIKKFVLFILFFLNLVYRHLYIDVYIYKLFQTCSIQIDLGTCLNRGYLIFAYIKTLDNVHKASPPVVA